MKTIDISPPFINPSEIVLINQLNANYLGHHLVDWMNSQTWNAFGHRGDHFLISSSWFQWISRSPGPEKLPEPQDNGVKLSKSKTIHIVKPYSYVCIYIYIYIYMYVCVYIYIYFYQIKHDITTSVQKKQPTGARPDSWVDHRRRFLASSCPFSWKLSAFYWISVFFLHSLVGGFNPSEKY